MVVVAFRIPAWKEDQSAYGMRSVNPVRILFVRVCASSSLIILTFCNRNPNKTLPFLGYSYERQRRAVRGQMQVGWVNVFWFDVDALVAICPARLKKQKGENEEW